MISVLGWQRKYFSEGFVEFTEDARSVGHGVALEKADRGTAGDGETGVGVGMYLDEEELP